MRGGWQDEPKCREITPAMEAQAMAMRRQGKTILEICRILDLSRSTEYQRIQRVVSAAGRRFQPGIEVGGPVKPGVLSWRASPRRGY